jgi:hypothetical protein
MPKTIGYVFLPFWFENCYAQKKEAEVLIIRALHFPLPQSGVDL